MKNSCNRCVIYTLVHLNCCDVCKIKYTTPSNNFFKHYKSTRQKMQLVCIQIKFQINVQLQIKVSKYYVSTYLQKFTYKYNICHKIIYTTFSYLYTKQCNNTFIHIFMSLENTFVTVIHMYILYKQNKKENFTCAIIYLPNSWFSKS